MADAFKLLSDVLLREADIDLQEPNYLLDSMPIIVAGPKRSGTAKAAAEICNKGYCGSKGIYYYGIKLHALAQSKARTLPVPAQMLLTPASENDLPVGKAMLADVYNINVFADKMYKDGKWEAWLKATNNVSINTPVKLKKGQERLLFMDAVFSSFISGIRQPIESFFNWLQEKTHIQLASKVRSASGLLSFVFARIAAVCFAF